MRPFTFATLVLGALGTAGYALVALLEDGVQSPVFRELVNTVQWSGRLHIIAGALALVLGLFQLSVRIRKCSIRLHQNIGNVYVAMVMLSTTGAIFSLPFSSSSWAAKSAFWFLAVLWPMVTIAGYPIGRPFSVDRHARFMIVSFALTCSAISLRIYLGSLLALGVTFEFCYPIAAWGAIISNLFAAGVILRLMQRSDDVLIENGRRNSRRYSVARVDS